MTPAYDLLAAALRKQNIRLSFRRSKVLEYLCRDRCHPTVDQVFAEIRKEISHLSKTTIYNILHTFAEAGIVRLINIEDHEVRYDINTEDHGHFKCEACGGIFDFRINPELLENEYLQGFKITDKNVYFKGICPKCL